MLLRGRLAMARTIPFNCGWSAARARRVMFLQTEQRGFQCGNESRQPRRQHQKNRSHPQFPGTHRARGFGSNGVFTIKEKIPAVGIEPTLPKEHDFESCASTNSATPA